METIQTYVKLDNEIHMMEMKNIRKNLKLKVDQLEDVKQTKAQLEDHYKKYKYSNTTSFKRFESKPVVKIIYIYTHCNL
jgi:hypothetical protein